MEHFIFTRFCIRIDKNTDRSQEDTWLRERVRIFERYLLPSLRGQTVDRFRWILMVSPTTPQWIWDRSLHWQPAEVFEFNSRLEIPTFLEREAREDRILCSRIDSDDAVSETFVEELQNSASTQQEWLVFANGVAAGNGSYYEVNDRPLSAFPTLIDQRPFVGPHCVQHPQLAKFAPVRVISNTRGWLIHAHQNNILNDLTRLKLGSQIPLEKVANTFHLDLKKGLAVKRVELINHLIERHEFQSYLEIGCARNKTFNKIKAQRKVGVDPKSGGTVRKTSDQFFTESDENFDIIFIDGLHLAEQVIRDVNNAINSRNSGGIIILHDCLPTLEVHQLRERAPTPPAWTGDVWKAVVECRTWTHIDTAVLNSDWGLGIILDRPNSSRYKLEKDFTDLDWNWFQMNSQTALRVIDSLDEFL